MKKLVANSNFTRKKNQKTKSDSSAGSKSPVLDVSHCRDLTTGKVKSVIRVVLHDQTTAKLSMPRSNLRSAASVTKALDDAGANLDSPILATEVLSLLHMNSENTRLERSQTGWVGGKFAYPRRKHQTIGGDVYFASRESVDPHLHPFFSIKGNSKGWWSAVGPIVRQSDFAIVGIAAVLAAPLMQFTTLSEGAIINFCGRSGGGKTTLALLAQSLMGSASAGDLTGWDNTLAGLEAVLGETKDTALIIDDQERGKASDRITAAQAAGRLAADGGKRRRSKSYEVEHGTLAKRHPRICLSSSEVSLMAEAADRGVTLKSGGSVRLIDIPVPDRDEGGFLNRPTKAAGKPTSTKQVALAITALSQHHGRPFRKYLRYLESHESELATKVSHLTARFNRGIVAEMTEGSLDGAAMRILDKFALLFAALCLGRESGLFDLAEERVTLAVSTCFHEARRALPKSPVPYAQAVEFLRVHLRDPEETPLEKKGVTINYSRSFKRRHGKIETAYVPSSRLPELVGISGLSIPPFVEHLSAIGALNGGHGAKTQTVKVCGANRRLLAFPKSFWGSSPASPVSRKV